MPMVLGEASDLSSTSRVLIAIISILYQPTSRDLTKLNEQLVSLSKKHGQVRQATVKMVEKAMEFMDELEQGSKDKEDLIATLREITEGKIYLEVQRARITRQLFQVDSLRSSSPLLWRSSTRFALPAQLFDPRLALLSFAPTAIRRHGFRVHEERHTELEQPREGTVTTSFAEMFNYHSLFFYPGTTGTPASFGCPLDS
ncbi:hypothetical protein JCM16303_007313 [Sporobolomyces ruberrimus]